MPRKAVDCGYHTNPGRRYGTLNQDSYLAYRIPDKDDAWVVGVFDGHGLMGESAAQLAASTIKDAFSTGIDGWVATVDECFKSPQASMTKLFRAAHDAIVKSYERLPPIYTYVRGKEYRLHWEGDVAVYRSSRTDKRDVEFGCTAIVAVYAGGMAVFANTGDSRAFVARRAYELEYDGGLLKLPNKVEEMTEVHTPANSSEVMRLTTNGRVTITPAEYVRPIDDRWISHQMAFTRALGHRHLEAFGITPEPYVRKYKVQNDDFALVLTTDGVTDALDDYDIGVHCDQPTAEKAAFQLVESALMLCTTDDEADNATALVLRI